MEKFVIPLSNVNQKDTDLVGFNAANLGALLEASFSVLNGICITTSAFQFALYPRREKISELLQKVDQQKPVDAVVVSSQIMSVLGLHRKNSPIEIGCKWNANDEMDWQ